MQLTGAVGRTAFGMKDTTTIALPSTDVEGTGLFGERGWLLGARIGLETDTPLGPVRAEYGWNNAKRGALLVRVGRWF